MLGRKKGRKEGKKGKKERKEKRKKARANDFQIDWCSIFPDNSVVVMYNPLQKSDRFRNT